MKVKRKRGVLPLGVLPLGVCFGTSVLTGASLHAGISPAGEVFGANANSQITSYYPTIVPFSQNVSIGAVNTQNAIPYSSSVSNEFWDGPWSVNSSVANIENHSAISIGNQTTAISSSYAPSGYVKGFNSTNASSSSTFTVTSPGIYQIDALCSELGQQPYDFTSAFSFNGNGTTLYSGSQNGSDFSPNLTGQMQRLGSDEFGDIWSMQLLPGETYTLTVTSASGSDAYGDQLDVAANGTISQAVPEPTGLALVLTGALRLFKRPGKRRQCQRGI